MPLGAGIGSGSGGGAMLGGVAPVGRGYPAASAANPLAGFLSALGGTSGNQAKAIAPAQPYKANIAADPRLAETYAAQKKFATDLGTKTTQQQEAALGFGRDMISQGLMRELQAAGARGAGAGSGLSQVIAQRALAGGGRELNRLNSDLTGQAIGAQSQALRDQSSTAGGVAGDITNKTGLANNMTVAMDRYNLDAANAANDSKMRMMDSMMRYFPASQNTGYTTAGAWTGGF